MAVVHALMLPLALLATACLPVAIAGILCADELIDRLVCYVGERLDALRERRTIRRLNHMVEGDACVSRAELARLDQGGAAIEHIAADLRRLRRQRLNPDNWSRVQQEAVIRAYDERLRQACRSLGVAEHLGDLDGVDLEIERIRVEGELHSAGLVLPAATTDRPQRST